MTNSPISNPAELPRSLDEILSPLHVALLNQISEVIQFRIEPNFDMKPGDTGFATDMRRKIIYYNPHTINDLPDYRRFACFAHELGHHFPSVVDLQDTCEKLSRICINHYLKKILPNERICKKIVDSGINILADVLLEDSVPKDSEVITKDLFKQAFRQNRGVLFLEYPEMEIDDDEEIDEEELEKMQETKELYDKLLQEFEDSGRKVFPWNKELLQSASPISQFTQLCLVAPFFGLPPEDYVSPAVANLYPKLQLIFSALRNSSTSGSEKSIQLISYVECIAELLENEMENIEDADDINATIASIIAAIDGDLETAERVAAPLYIIVDEGEGDVNINGEGGDSATAIAIRGQIEKGLNAANAADDALINQEASLLGVTPEILREYNATCSTYKSEIDELTKVLTEFVLQQFDVILCGGQRGGLMTEFGREGEAYMRALAGEESPPTDLNTVLARSPKTLQLYNLIDTSGSMSWDLGGTLGFFTIFSQAVLNIHEELKKRAGQYDLSLVSGAPLQVEMTGFDSSPKLIFPLTEDVTKKKLVQGYRTIKERTIRGGGTNDERALKFEYNRMKIKDPTCIKVLSMLTDGGGQGDGIEPILRQIEEDPSIYFMVNGIGEHGDLVRQYYQNKFRPTYYYHVSAHASATVQEAIQKNMRFLINCVRENFKRMDA